MESVDLMYPLYHYQYQVKIPVVYVVMNNLILMEIFVDEILISKTKKNIFQLFFFSFATFVLYVEFDFELLMNMIASVIKK